MATTLIRAPRPDWRHDRLPRRLACRGASVPVGSQKGRAPPGIGRHSHTQRTAPADLLGVASGLTGRTDALRLHAAPAIDGTRCTHVGGSRGPFGPAGSTRLREFTLWLKPVPGPACRHHSLTGSPRALDPRGLSDPKEHSTQWNSMAMLMLHSANPLHRNRGTITKEGKGCTERPK